MVGAPLGPSRQVLAAIPPGTGQLGTQAIPAAASPCDGLLPGQEVVLRVGLAGKGSWQNRAGLWQAGVWPCCGLTAAGDDSPKGWHWVLGLGGWGSPRNGQGQAVLEEPQPFGHSHFALLRRVWLPLLHSLLSSIYRQDILIFIRAPLTFSRLNTLSSLSLSS